MNSPEPREAEPLEYAVPRETLNPFQKVSVFVLRLCGVGLLLAVAGSWLDVIVSRSRGYDVSWYYFFDPGTQYFVLGLICLLFARPIGMWLGSGLGPSKRE